jgi:hypothetical protein
LVRKQRNPSGRYAMLFENRFECSFGGIVDLLSLHCRE